MQTGQKAILTEKLDMEMSKLFSIQLGISSVPVVKKFAGDSLF